MVAKEEMEIDAEIVVEGKILVLTTGCPLLPIVPGNVLLISCETC
jgi:hypothetical protein